MFRAVGRKCAVNLSELDLPITVNVSLKTLKKRGFKIFDCDIVATAKSFVGKSSYKLGAKQHEAPNTFDCSSFTKWLYGKCGIWLPRRSIQQIDEGIPIGTDSIQAGDLVFTTSQHRSWFRFDPSKNVGHVGIATGNGTVIHASSSKIGIIETSIKTFLNPKKFRGIRRIIPEPENTFFFQTPPNREIETSDDFFWVTVQTLSSKI